MRKCLEYETLKRPHEVDHPTTPRWQPILSPVLNDNLHHYLLSSQQTISLLPMDPYIALVTNNPGKFCLPLAKLLPVSQLWKTAKQKIYLGSIRQRESSEMSGKDSPQCGHCFLDIYRQNMDFMKPMKNSGNSSVKPFNKASLWSARESLRHRILGVALGKKTED